MKLTGIVRWFSAEKKFGFIKEDDSDAEYFVHVTNCDDPINKDDLVEFETKPNYSGKVQAINVKRI